MNGTLSGIILTISLSLVQGVSVIHLCVGKTSSSTTCASGEVVLITEAFRVQVPFSTKEHCGYQNGDFKENDLGATKTVLKDCNLWPNCDVKFLPLSRKEFMEIHYECLTRTAIPAISVCQASYLEGNHGYIHSPGYPGLVPSTNVPTRCNCSATLSELSKITVKVFNTFSDGQQTLNIKWDSKTELLFKSIPHFKEYTHSATKTFSLDFSSDIRNSLFWLEYRTDIPLRVHCRDKTAIPSVTTPFITTSSTTRPTTTTKITSMTTTKTTTTETITTNSERTPTPTDANNTSSAAFDTTVPSTNGPTARYQNEASSTITLLGVFLAVTMILIVILTTLLLHRMGIFARFCKGRTDDGKQDDVDQVQLENRPAFRLGAPGVHGTEGANYENVGGPGKANAAFTDIQDLEANGNLVTNDCDLYVNVGATADTRGVSGLTKGKSGTYENVGSTYENGTVEVAQPEESAYQEVGGRGDRGVTRLGVDPGHQRELDSTYASIGTIDRREHAEYADLRQAHYKRTK